MHKIGGLLEPATNVVKIFYLRENILHVRFLRGGLISEADKRRVADYVVDFGRDGCPVDFQCVAFANVGVTFQRQKIQVVMNNFLRLLHHLKFGNPQRGLSHGNSKVVDLNAVELPD